jgi:hypothetical protein
MYRVLSGNYKCRVGNSPAIEAVRMTNESTTYEQAGWITCQVCGGHYAPGHERDHNVAMDHVPGDPTPKESRLYRRLQAEAVRLHERDGLSPAKIRARFLEQAHEAPSGVKVPSERTIRYWLPQSRPAKSPPWSLLTGKPGEAEHVLPVLAYLIEARGSGLPDQITRDEARWIARLGPVTAGLPPRQLLYLARAYLDRERAGQDSRSLDVGLALTPWLDGAERYARAFESGTIAVLHYILIDQVGIERLDHVLDVPQKVKP